jgi:hypothetical protein
MPENPFTLTVRATVTVTDLGDLVRQVDELVALSDDFQPIEDGTYFDGFDDREGSGYLFQGDAVWLDDDPDGMLTLAVALSPLRAKAVDIELDADVTRKRRRPRSTDLRFTVEAIVYGAEVTSQRSASAWLGSLKDVRPTVLAARATVALLDTLAGCEVEIDSVVAERPDLAPGRYASVSEAEIPLVPPADPDPDRLPPGEPIVVTNGGRHYETDENGRLVNRPPGYPTDRSLRRPVRFDGDTARTLVHFMHPIPVGRGFLMAWVTDNVPGWDGNGLISALGSAGLIDSSGSMPKLVDGVAWVDIVPSGLCTRVELEQNALGRPVKPRIRS